MSEHKISTANARSIGITASLAFQHVVILFSGIGLVPIMLGKLHDLPLPEVHYILFATTICSAVAMLLQLTRFGWFGPGNLMFMGTSGAFLACSHAAIKLGGFTLLSTMVLISAPFQALFSFFFRYIRRILTPTVGGIIIMLAMVGLLKDSTMTWVGNLAQDNISAWPRIIVGTCTISALVLTEWFGGRTFRPWSVVIGLALGCIIAWPLGVIDLTPAASAPWTGFPDQHWPGLAFESSAEEWVLYLTFVMATLVTSVKYVGDSMALQKITRCNNKKTDYDSIQGGLYASAASSLISGLAGGMPPTSQSQNLPIIEITGNSSRRVGIATITILVLLSLCPKVVMLLLSIPGPVLGATGIFLVGHLFSTGMRLAVGEGLSFRNGLIIGLSLAAGLIVESDLFFPGVLPGFLHPLLTNGFAVGGMLAVALTVLSNMSSDKWKSIKLKPEHSSLDRLQAVVGEVSAKSTLTPRALSYLELACEEVFMHMVDEFSTKKFKGFITFRFMHNVNGMHIEASGGLRVSQMDTVTTNMTREISKFNEEEMASLGIHLLNRVAEDINHIHISNYSYIDFRIPRDAR